MQKFFYGNPLALLLEANRIVLGKNPMASAQSSHEEPFLGLGDLPLMIFQGFLAFPLHVYSCATFCCAECGFYFLSTLLSIPTNDPADPAICPIFLWKSLIPNPIGKSRFSELARAGGLRPYSPTL